MAKPVVEDFYTFDEWRLATNQISNNVGNPTDVYTSPVATTGVPQNTQPADVILALNNLEARKADELNPSVSGTLTVTGDIVVNTGTITGNGSGITNLDASDLAAGTVPTARLGSGTANNTSILQGDSTWMLKSSLITELNLATKANSIDDAISMAIALG